MKILHLIIVLNFFSINLSAQAFTQATKVADKFITIGNGELEFKSPSDFDDIEIKVQSETSATTFINSERYDAQITIMSEVLPEEIATSYNNSATQAPEGVVKSVPYNTKFGKSLLHYSLVQFKPGATSHEFNTVINTPEALLMVLCYTHSGSEEKIKKIEKSLIDAFKTLRVVR